MESNKQHAKEPMEEVMTMRPSMTERIANIEQILEATERDETEEAADLDQLEKEQAPRPDPMIASQPGAVPVAGIDADQQQQQQRRDTIQIGSSKHLIKAYTVNSARAELKAELEEEMRQQYMEDVVEANVVDESVGRRKVMVAGLMLLIVVAGVVLLTILLTQVNNNGASDTQTIRGDTLGSTLDQIRERGYVKCGAAASFLGFSSENVRTGEVEGINADQCRAVSMAIFGEPNNVDFVEVSPSNRFVLLANKTVDVLTNTITHTFQRDIYFPQTKTGFTFSTPYLYGGMIFWGREGYLECAEALDSNSSSICQDTHICVASLSTFELMLRSLFPSDRIVPAATAKALTINLDEDNCQVVAADRFNSNDRLNRITAGKRLFSKDPLTLVTREDDPEFSSLVDMVVNVFYLAEAHNISKHNSEELHPFVSPDLEPLATSIIEEFGNYADIYQRHLEPMVPRDGLNMLYTNKDRSGLLYPLPFFGIQTVGPEPDSDNTITRILERGHVRCGVALNTAPSLLYGESWTNFNVEFCKVLSAALFKGSTDLVEMIPLLESSAADLALANGDVDAVAGMQLSISSDYKEPTMGEGFSFSKPFFYHTEKMQAYGFATTKEDQQWSDLVSWLGMTVVYAEELGIGQSTAQEMPHIKLFGLKLKTMLQDVIAGVGSYEEIYSRTLEGTKPRTGSGNELNHDLAGPQQYPISFT